MWLVTLQYYSACTTNQIASTILLSYYTYKRLLRPTDAVITVCLQMTGSSSSRSDYKAHPLHVKVDNSEDLPRPHPISFWYCTAICLVNADKDICQMVI